MSVFCLTALAGVTDNIMDSNHVQPCKLDEHYPTYCKATGLKRKQLDIEDRSELQ